MFRCDRCKRQSEPGARPKKVVVEVREVQYPPREAAHSGGFSDPGGFGTEIVREQKVCEECWGEGA